MTISSDNSHITTFLTLGGRIRCMLCKAQPKRSKKRYRSPAMRGNNVCGFHGGKPTEPNTAEGRRRRAAAKSIYGRETRELRAAQSDSGLPILLFRFS
jgi:hypothetical protein